MVAGVAGEDRCAAMLGQRGLQRGLGGAAADLGGRGGRGGCSGRSAAPSAATRKSSPGVNRPSLSDQGAETSGMPQASASKTRMVGMPGSIEA